MQKVGRLCYTPAAALNINVTAQGQTLFRALLLNSPCRVVNAQTNGQPVSIQFSPLHLTCGLRLPLLSTALNTDLKRQCDSWTFIHLNKQGITYWHLGRTQRSVPHNSNSTFKVWIFNENSDASRDFPVLLQQSYLWLLERSILFNKQINKLACFLLHWYLQHNRIYATA